MSYQRYALHSYLCTPAKLKIFALEYTHHGDMYLRAGGTGWTWERMGRKVMSDSKEEEKDERKSQEAKRGKKRDK